MADDHSMSVKAVLVLKDRQEIRRFGIPEDLTTNFAYLEERIRKCFQLGSQQIIVTWEDNEGDSVRISSDEELLVAIGETMTEKNKPVLRLYVNLGDNTTQDNNDGWSSCNGQKHKFITCDGCNGPVNGFRYKCVTCADYDLCGSCEAKGVHNQHRMIRYPTPQSARNFNVSINDDGMGIHMFQTRGPPHFRRGGGRMGCRNSWRNHCGEQSKGCSPSQGQCEEEENKEKKEGSKQENKSFPHHPPPFMAGGAGIGGMGCPFTSFTFGTGPEGVHSTQTSTSSCHGGVGSAGFGFPPPPPPPPMPPMPPTEEIQQQAFQMASKHVADLMKGIWTAWSGQSQAQSQSQTGCGQSQAQSNSGPTSFSSSSKASNMNSTKESDDNCSMDTDCNRGCQPDNDCGTNTKSDKGSQQNGDEIEVVATMDKPRNAGENPSQKSSATPTPNSIYPKISTQQEDDDVMEVEVTLPPQQNRDSTSPELLTDWTMLNSGAEPEQPTSQSQKKNVEDTPTINKENHKPSSQSQAQSQNFNKCDDPKVQRALDHMLAMGYNNEGGWLTHLITMKNGDINLVLDLLHPSK